MIPSTLRRRVLLLYLGYRVGELVQIGAEGIEEAQDGVPSDAPPTALDLGDVGRMDAEPNGHLLLRHVSLIAQRLERPAEHDLILSSVTHLSGFSQVVVSSRSPNIVPPHRCHGRGRGTEDQRLRRAGHDIRSGHCGPSPGHPIFGASYQGGTDMTTLTIPADVVTIVRNALHTDIGQDAYDIQGISETGHGDVNPEQYEELLKHFDAHRALLDVIGWGKPDSDEPVQIDPIQHQWALLTTLETRLEVEHDLMQVEPHLKGAGPQRERATRYARMIESFLPTVRARVEQIGGQ
jgi:hypothetical protein